MGGEEEGGFDRPGGSPRFHRHTNRLFVLWAFIFFPFAFGACHSEQRGGGAGSLEERVKGFWEARVAGDDLKAYAYEAYSKTGKMTPTQYVRARTALLQYKSYEVRGIAEQGDEATVTIDLRYRFVSPISKDLNLTMNLQERWIRLDGQWYRQLEKPEEGQPPG